MKIEPKMILTALLISAVCFLSFPHFASSESAFASMNESKVEEKWIEVNLQNPMKKEGVRIEFECHDKKVLYDESNLKIDKQNFDTLKSLRLRGFLQGQKKKLDIIDEVMKFGFSRDEGVDYVLVGLNQLIDDIDEMMYVQPIDSTVKFDPNAEKMFSVSIGQHGLTVDRKALYEKIFAILKSKGSGKISVPTTVLGAKTQGDNEKNLKLKAVFATDYSISAEGRKSNIHLALAKFNGMVILPGEQVSFNKTVGARTVQNGFKEAKIIVDGKYVVGVGGGVCQASTTLYNAVLLAGLRLDSWHRHSLQSSYVLPSFDAMVNSGSSDLVFCNDTSETIYLKTVCTDTEAKVFVYGAPNKFEIERKYKVVGRIPAKTKIIIDTLGEYIDKVKYDDETYVLEKSLDGLQSEGFLIFKKNGQVVSEKLIRRDSYKAIDGVIVKGSLVRPEWERFVE